MSFLFSFVCPFSFLICLSFFLFPTFFLCRFSMIPCHFIPRKHFVLLFLSPHTCSFILPHFDLLFLRIKLAARVAQAAGLPFFLQHSYLFSHHQQNTNTIMVTIYSSLVGLIPENELTFAQLKTEHTEHDVYVSFFPLWMEWHS